MSKTNAQHLDGDPAMLFGAAGVHVIVDTSEVEGDFFAVHLLTDTNFDTFDENGAKGGAMTGFAIAAGQTLTNALGIRKIKLASGKVRAFYR
jgi:hypothetical protein